VKAIQNDVFFDHLYATLTAWGLHRPGTSAAKLNDLDVIKQSFHKQHSTIKDLQDIKLCEVHENDIFGVTSKVWNVLGALNVSASKSNLVANSKALHHLLPDLVPPIDREYTLTFYFNHKNMYRPEEEIFSDIYPHFHRIAMECRDNIRKHLGSGMNTSETKIIDNAIVGFVLTEIKGKKIRGSSRSGNAIPDRIRIPHKVPTLDSRDRLHLTKAFAHLCDKYTKQGLSQKKAVQKACSDYGIEFGSLPVMYSTHAGRGFVEWRRKGWID